jgi:hypothetical protein
MSLKLIAINCTVTYCNMFDQDLQVPQALYSSNSALAAHVSSLDCFRASALTLDGTTANAGIHCIHVEPL